MNYQYLRQLLAKMGIWAPAKPGRRNPRLHCGDRNVQPIPGTYLNETKTGMAYFTLLSNCALRENKGLWLNLPHELVHKGDEKYRNIYPKHGKERDALLQLFQGICS